MSIVRAVRTLVDSVQGLPEAARREIIDILDELEGKTPPAPVAPPIMHDPAAVPEEVAPAGASAASVASTEVVAESPAEAPAAPDVISQESAVEPADPTAEPDPADAPVNTQVV